MKKFRNIVLLVLAAAVLGYCAVRALNSRVEFDVVALKREGERIYDVRIWFEEFPMFRFGDLQARESEMGEAGFSMHYGIWPSEVMVEWKEGNREGEPTTIALPVSKRMSFSRKEVLQLVIEFKEDEVVAYPRVRERLDRGLRYRYGD